MAWNPYDDKRPEWDDPQGPNGGPDGGWNDPEPIRPRRRSPIALGIVALIAFMFIWEALQTPPDPDARFNLVVEDTVAYAFGGTDVNSFDDVRNQLDANPQVQTIVLRHVPGTTHLGENTRIARLIRARGIDTHLESSSFIASGGVDLFLAGVERTMECGARIGVHSWQNENGDNPRSLGFDPIEDGMRAFHAEIDVDPDFYSFARDAAPHSSLYFLDRDDLERFDILTDGTCEGTDWFGFLPWRR